jgi:hypothetical protein
MARLRTAKDGHPYLTHGYPVLDQFGQLDVRFSTYQLYDTAESLLREAGLQEGASLPREPIYEVAYIGVAGLAKAATTGMGGRLKEPRQE